MRAFFSNTHRPQHLLRYASAHREPWEPYKLWHSDTEIIRDGFCDEDDHCVKNLLYKCQFFWEWPLYVWYIPVGFFLYTVALKEQWNVAAFAQIKKNIARQKRKMAQVELQQEGDTHFCHQGLHKIMLQENSIWMNYVLNI